MTFSNGRDFPLTDGFAAIAPRFSGGLSCISSAFIIYVILRSERKLSTIYHRLMFAMSCTDIMGSVAMGLTTLPMPREVSFHGWDGTKLGNIQTCEAQAFFFTFGIFAMFTYNITLCSYYTCAIAFKMKEDRIKKRVEPLFHMIPLLAGLTASVPPLFMQMYNPTGWDAWCTVAPNNELGRGVDIRVDIFVKSLILRMIAIMILAVIICFILIIWRVFSTEKILSTLTPVGRNGRIIVRRSQMRHQSQVQSSHENTKVVLVQAAAYMSSFLLTLLFPFLRSVLPQASLLIIRLQIVITPLQGFFNAIIFISHKIYNYRRVHIEVSICDVLLKLLLERSMNEPVLLSRISRIEINAGSGSVNIEIADEAHVEHATFNLNDVPLAPQNDAGSGSVNVEIADEAHVEHATFNLNDVPLSPQNDEDMDVFVDGDGTRSRDLGGFSTSRQESQWDSSSNGSNAFNFSRGGLSGFSQPAQTQEGISNFANSSQLSVSVGGETFSGNLSRTGLSGFSNSIAP